MYLEFFHCASYKKKLSKSVQYSSRYGVATDKQTDHDALGTPPSPPQTRSTSFRSARFASLATQVIINIFMSTFKVYKQDEVEYAKNVWLSNGSFFIATILVRLLFPAVVGGSLGSCIKYGSSEEDTDDQLHHKYAIRE